MENIISVERITPKDAKANVFLVEVESGSARTQHTVGLSEDYYQTLCGGKIPAEELIEKSFKFLLERESSSSILREFDLPVIEEYFSEYKKEILK